MVCAVGDGPLRKKLLSWPSLCPVAVPCNLPSQEIMHSGRAIVRIVATSQIKPIKGGYPFLVIAPGFDSLRLQDHSQHAPQDPQQFFATFFLNMRIDLSFHLISRNQQINGHLSRKIGHGSDDSMNWWNCVPGVGDLQDNVVSLCTIIGNMDFVSAGIPSFSFNLSKVSAGERIWISLETEAVRV